jgi:DNA primase
MHVYANADNPHFYCFGCGAGGSAFTFIQLIENLDFPEAVRFLAQKAGLDVPEAGSSSRESGVKTRLLEMNKEAARFYRDVLQSPEGVTGLNYLYMRGLAPNTIRKYGLGFAPPGWDALKKHMRSKGYSEDELVEASLLSRGNKGNTYDFFRYRIMFPLIDRRGNVIAFGSRAVDPDDKQFKYLNSKETAVFKKSASLFSINFAKNSADKKSWFLCEGNMDVIMLNQAGFDNAVATCGTAITAEQARLMRQYCEQVIIATDSDTAGQKAAEKAVNLLGQAGLAAKVLELPADTKDPDDYIKKYGAEAFAALAEKSRSVISFELKKAARDIDLDTLEGKAEYLGKATAILAGIENKTEREVYISETARICGVQIDALKANVAEHYEKVNSKWKKRKEETQNLMRGKGEFRSKLESDEILHEPQALAERTIISYLFHSPDKLADIISRVSPTDFPTEFNAKVLKTLVLRLSQGLSLDGAMLGSEFSAQEMGRIEAIKHGKSELPFTSKRLSESIEIIEKFKTAKHKKSPADMTAEELLEYSRMLKKS